MKLKLFKKHRPTKAELREEQETISGELPFKKILPIFLALILSMLLAALDQTIVSTALPTIAGELHGLDKISWLVTAYLLAQTVSVPLYGKLGDEFGRKRLLMLAIVIFLAGSALAGLSQTMVQLIACRALQGIGAGGLMVSAIAIMGDIVPARKRGKYVGIMMPVFGLATAFGPAIGGFLIDNLSWRWIFYVNMPVGIAAILAVSFLLKLPTHVPKRLKIDYLGAALLAAAVACLVFLTSWGGRNYDWQSWPIYLLGLGVLILGTAFVWQENRAYDPVFPLKLFSNRVFLVCVLLGLTVGLGMFGALTYLPTFLQTVNGVSPTDSGLMMIPMSAGLMAAAITVGQIMTRTGHYKIFPIIGTAVATFGMYLLSTMNAHTPQWHINVYMAVLGMGIGAVMPVLTTVAQNSVKKQDLGVATSGVNFFRQIGGAIGVSIAGTLFTTRLHTQLVKDLPALADKFTSGGQVHIDPATVGQLPPHIQAGVIEAFGTALPSIFLDFAPMFAVAFVIAFFLKEVPLATTMRGAVRTASKNKNVVKSGRKEATSPQPARAEN